MAAKHDLKYDPVDVYRSIILGPSKSWVIFEYGTCVILTEPENDLRSQAIDLMKQWGEPHGGSPAGDFAVSDLGDYPGYIVRCHHPDILVYVSPDDVEGSSEALRIGMLGRLRRALDARDLRIIHIEDRRGIARAGEPGTGSTEPQ